MEKYNISNNLIFALVMQDKEICKRFLERIFDGKVVKELNLKYEINLDEYESAIEKKIISNPESSSVRLEVLFEGDNGWCDIDMQFNLQHFSPKKMRYYASLMDKIQLDKDKRAYEKNTMNYVIFICDFDYYQKGDAVYEFEFYDTINKIKLGDQSQNIVLNTKCSMENTPESLRGLYNYIDKDIVDSKDDLVKDMDLKVKEYSKDKRLRHIMTLADEMKKTKEEIERL